MCCLFCLNSLLVIICCFVILVAVSGFVYLISDIFSTSQCNKITLVCSHFCFLVFVLFCLTFYLYVYTYICVCAINPQFIISFA